MAAQSSHRPTHSLREMGKFLSGEVKELARNFQTMLRNAYSRPHTRSPDACRDLQGDKDKLVRST